jgi:hypothetical protein
MLRSIFYKNDRSTQAKDPEALDGQNSLTLAQTLIRDLMGYSKSCSVN